MFFHPTEEIFSGLSAADIAIEAANASECFKSKRGVCVFSEDFEQLFFAYNSPPHPFKCFENEFCRSVCNKIAVHAEERAILGADFSLFNGELVHVKTVKGELVASGLPSCWQCSRKIVEVGLLGVWLFHEKGWKRYSSLDFHKITLQNNNII